jgi:hypothetical protein
MKDFGDPKLLSLRNAHNGDLTEFMAGCER